VSAVAIVLIYVGVASVFAVFACALCIAAKRGDEAWARAMDDEERAREQLGYGHYGYELTTQSNGTGPVHRVP
jgi:hypothetical protein